MPYEDLSFLILPRVSHAHLPGTEGPLGWEGKCVTWEARGQGLATAASRRVIYWVKYELSQRKVGMDGNIIE